jgi:hypothetical protein
MIAPRPLLVINGHPELLGFALPDAQRSVAYGKTVYSLFGKPDAIRFHESSTGHGYQPDKRTQLYEWLQRWFFAGKMPHGVADLAYEAESRDNFRVGLPENNLSIPALARQWVDESPQSPASPVDPEEAHAWQRTNRLRLEHLLARPKHIDSPGVSYRYDYKLVAEPYHAERLPFEMEPDLIEPGVLVRRDSSPKYKAIIFLGKRGCQSSEATALVDRGYALLCLDPAGTGEVDWGGGRTTNWADFMGRPAIGIWAEDISRAATYLLSRPDIEQVGVLGYGVFGKAALYAAALDERIRCTAVTLDTATYRSEATSGLVHVFADVPRILTWGDTPELAALVAPRPLAVLSAGLPVSYNGERPNYFSQLPKFNHPDTGASEAGLHASFAWTQSFYGVLAAESNFGIGLGNRNRSDAVVEWFSGRF